MSYMHETLKLTSRFLFGYILCLTTWQPQKNLREAMEIILAICVTGLNLRRNARQLEWSELCTFYGTWHFPFTVERWPKQHRPVCTRQLFMSHL